jgi:hypothetical protein
MPIARDSPQDVHRKVWLAGWPIGLCGWVGGLQVAGWLAGWFQVGWLVGCLRGVEHFSCV